MTQEKGKISYSCTCIHICITFNWFIRITLICSYYFGVYKALFYNPWHLTWHNNCLDSWLCRWSWLVWRWGSTVCFRGERLGRRHRFAFIQFGTRLITVPFLGWRLWLLIGDWWTVLFVNERIPCAFHRIKGVSWILRTIWTWFRSKNLGEKPPGGYPV